MLSFGTAARVSTEGSVGLGGKETTIDSSIEEGLFISCLIESTVLCGYLLEVGYFEGGTVWPTFCISCTETEVPGSEQQGCVMGR